MIQIEYLKEKHFNAYEEFILKNDTTLLYHSLKYKKLLEELLDADSIYILALIENEIVGALPLMVKNGVFGKVLNSLPFYGSNGGVISKNNQAKIELISFYEKLVNSGEYISSTLIENPIDKNYSYEVLKANEIDYRIGQLSHIEGEFTDYESIMKLFHYKTRNMIRKAIKSNVTVEINNEMFPFLIETHKENMKTIGGQFKSDSFFEKVQQIFESNSDYRLYVARINGEPVAALLLFYYNKVVEYYTPVIVSKYRSFQPLSLIITEAMFQASKEGYKWWNWGGTWTNQEGVFDFKTKWGTSNINYNYYININDPKVYTYSKEQLLNNYSGFYVLPFSKLIAK